MEIWFTVPNAINAPNSDSQLLKDVIHYRKIHPEIVNAALDKLSWHLWYFLFGSFWWNCDSRRKSKDYTKINSQVAVKKPSKRFGVAYEEITSFELSHEFLCTHPSLWESNLEYKRCYDTFKTLKVVNDTAERGVALAESFNEALTHNEDERQRIFQTVLFFLCL